MLTDLVHQQAAFLIANISRRRTIEQSHRVLFLILRHVEAQHGGLVVEEEVCQRLSQLGLTSTGRAKEEERAHRLTLLVQSRTTLKDGIEDALDGVVLTHNSLMENLFGVAELLALLRLNVTHWDTSHLCNDIANGVLLQLLLLDIFFLLFCQVGHLVGNLHRRHSTVEQVESR